MRALKLFECKRKEQKATFPHLRLLDMSEVEAFWYGKATLSTISVAENEVIDAMKSHTSNDWKTSWVARISLEMNS